MSVSPALWVLETGGSLEFADGSLVQVTGRSFLKGRSQRVIEQDIERSPLALTQASAHTCAYTSVHTCAYSSAHTCAYTSVHACVYTSVHACAYTMLIYILFSLRGSYVLPGWPETCYANQAGLKLTEIFAT